MYCTKTDTVHNPTLILANANKVNDCHNRAQHKDCVLVHLK